MADIRTIDMVYVAIEHTVPRRRIGGPEVSSYWRGSVETAAPRDWGWGFYDLSAAGIEPIEVRAQTESECEIALNEALVARGWQNRAIWERDLPRPEPLSDEDANTMSGF